MDFSLGQRSRAALEFLGETQRFAGGTLQRVAAEEYERAVPEPPPDLDGRRASVATALADSAAWRFDRLFTRWVAEEVYVRALPAIEEIRGQVEEWLDVESAPGTLRLNPALEPPEYWREGFHLAPGGWDGHDLMGSAIAELVYRYVLVPGGVGAVRTGENLLDQRTIVAREAPHEDYRRIVELGCGSGRFTFALNRTYPRARLTGVDLSTTSLRHAHALAAEGNLPIDWVQAPAEDTGLPAGQADLVAAYTLLHEVPTEDNRRILAEAHRLLAPGGDLLISEIAAYHRQSAFRAVVLDWETEHRGEPHWRAALCMDLPEMLRQAGFTEIEAYGVDGGNYPWVTRARKPAGDVPGAEETR